MGITVISRSDNGVQYKPRTEKTNKQINHSQVSWPVLVLLLSSTSALWYTEIPLGDYGRFDQFMTHSKGCVEKNQTYVASPDMYISSGMISCSFPSSAGEMSNAARMEAIEIQSVERPMKRPGQMRRPYPNATSAVHTVAPPPGR
jgi:hypothetical protein